MGLLFSSTNVFLELQQSVLVERLENTGRECHHSCCFYFPKPLTDAVLFHTSHSSVFVDVIKTILINPKGICQYMIVAIKSCYYHNTGACV